MDTCISFPVLPPTTAVSPGSAGAPQQVLVSAPSLCLDTGHKCVVVNLTDVQVLRFWSQGP
jgi:hypothetical protein